MEEIISDKAKAVLAKLTEVIPKLSDRQLDRVQASADTIAMVFDTQATKSTDPTKKTA